MNTMESPDKVPQGEGQKKKKKRNKKKKKAEDS
jgi:hypothetical protein